MQRCGAGVKRFAPAGPGPTLVLLPRTLAPSPPPEKGIPVIYYLALRGAGSVARNSREPMWESGG